MSENKTWVCPICKAEFDSWNEFIIHEGGHIKEDLKKEDK